MSNYPLRRLNTPNDLPKRKKRKTPSAHHSAHALSARLKEYTIKWELLPVTTRSYAVANIVFKDQQTSDKVAEKEEYLYPLILYRLINAYQLGLF
jgi:hypothetical protein